MWETQDHMHLVSQLEAAEPLSFSKKRCDGKLDSVLAPARRTWSYDDCTLGISIIWRMTEYVVKVRLIWFVGMGVCIGLHG